MCTSTITNSVRASANRVWRPDDGTSPAPPLPATDIYRPDILETIASRIKEIDGELKALSLDIHGAFLIKFLCTSSFICPEYIDHLYQPTPSLDT